MAAANKAARSVDRVKEPEAAAVATAIVATREGVEDLMGGGAGGGAMISGMLQMWGKWARETLALIIIIIIIIIINGQGRLLPARASRTWVGGWGVGGVGVWQCDQCEMTALGKDENQWGFLLCLGLG